MSLFRHLTRKKTPMDWGLIFVLALFVLVRINFIDIVPFWDAASVTDCILESVEPKFRPSRLNCHHPSMGYLFLLSWGQFIDLGNTHLLNITSLILALIAISAFHYIAQNLFSDSKVRLNKELVLLTSLLAFNPLFLAHSINPDLDFALTSFFLISLFGLIYQRKTLTIIALTLLVFSKEPGLILYLILVGGHLFFKALNTTREKSLIQQSLAYLLPMVLFAAYYVYQKTHVGPSLLWSSEFNPLFGFALRDPKSVARTLTRLAQAFVLNFQWIYSLVIAFFGVKLFKSRQTKNQSWLVLALCFIAYAYPVFLLNTYTLPRYVLPLIPLLIIFFYFALRGLIADWKIRSLLLLAILWLMLIQNFYSLDPVSKQIFGTFSFGNHQLYKMTRYVDECCGIGGKDQLAYNTQYLAIDKLISKLYQQIDLSADVPLFVSSLDGAEIFSPADKCNLKRTFRKTNIITPTVYISPDLQYFPLHQLPSKAYYIYLPWNDVLELEISTIEEFYSIGKEHTVDYQGYALHYYPLQLKKG